MNADACRDVRPDTIVAVSSAAGASERAILRISGSQAVAVAGALFAPTGERTHSAVSLTPTLSRGERGESVAVSALPAWSVVKGVLRIPAFVAPVPALLYLMRASRSYTREDVVEFHIVGSPPVASAALDEIVSRGVRLARPGEFTERAYLSGRIDLSQAEAVLKLIHARTDAEERLAVGELTGALARRIGEITERLVETLTRVELSLDFSEDDVPLVAPGELADELSAAADAIDDLHRFGVTDAVFSERPRVSIVGRANAGKSSLFNRLLDRDEAIVTDILGTTRDVLEAEHDLDGTDILLVDTAGEKTATEKSTCATAGLSSRASAGEGNCPVTPLTPTLSRGERGRSTDASTDPDDLALTRAREEHEKADLLLLVIDASQPLTAIDMTLLARLSSVPPLPTPVPNQREGAGGEGQGEGGINRPEGAPAQGVSIVVLNKTDLAVNDETERIVRSRAIAVSVSCKTGYGLDRLRDEIRQSLTTGVVDRSGQRFLFNLRQRDTLRRAKASLDCATAAARDEVGLEFVAAELRASVNHLRELTHPLDEEEILDRIFSRFCIGK